MNTLPIEIIDIINNYKEEIDIAEKKKNLLDELEYNHFCDYCDKKNCVIKFKDCWKLEEPVIAEGWTFSYAWNCGFCNYCIKLIKNFDRYYPNNT